MEYFTVKEASESWNIDISRIGKLLRAGKIKGAEKIGGHWVIPKNAPKPLDGRTKTGKEAVEQDSFRFPFYVNSAENSFVPPLTHEEKLLRLAQIDFYACDFDKIGDTFSVLYQNAESIYVKLSALLHEALLCLLTGESKKATDCFALLKKKLSGDFPHKKDLEIFIPWFHDCAVELSAVAEKLEIEPDYDYCRDFWAWGSYLSFVAYAEKRIVNPGMFKPDIYEITCRKLESDGFYYEAEELHLALFWGYLPSNDKRKMDYHLRKALDIASERNIVLPLAYYCFYYKDVFNEVYSLYPNELMDKAYKYSEIIRVNIEQYKMRNAHIDMYNALSQKHIQLLPYAVMGYSNKKVAQILNLSERTVASRYTEIYDKLNISGKQELVEMAIQSLH